MFQDENGTELTHLCQIGPSILVFLLTILECSTNQYQGMQFKIFISLLRPNRAFMIANSAVIQGIPFGSTVCTCSIHRMPGINGLRLPSI